MSLNTMYYFSMKNTEIIRKNKDDITKLLDIKHYYYFIFAPTLCFQLSYPRNERIRKVWLLKRVGEAIGCTIMQAYTSLKLPRKSNCF